MIQYLLLWSLGLVHKFFQLYTHTLKLHNLSIYIGMLLEIGSPENIPR